MSASDAAAMWVFGYGSLMWDGWETPFGCRQRLHAEAPQHRRVFNKKSLERWGTRASPGLTLNLLPLRENEAPCQGIAFEFPDAHQAGIEAYLSERETCHASNIDIRFSDRAVTARTYIYEGPRLIDDDLSLRTRARMVLMAEGIAGSSYDYVSNVRDHLQHLGMTDPAVDELWSAVVAVRDGDQDE